MFLGYILVVLNHQGIESIALAFSVSNIVQLIILFFLLNRKVGGFEKRPLLLSLTKFSIATILTGFALYIPIKLLDQLVFDTTRTINLIMLTGISSFAGLSLYLFLTWFLNIHEARTYIEICKNIGNWRDILKKSDEVIDPNRTTT
jgi:peptidoglycan biosynthesis protein MviN/MurJ (putative lipid II flippase)